MARFPGAIYKPITVSKGRDRLTLHNRMNLHVAVSEGSSLHAFFNQPGQVDSHFYVRRDGTVEQYVDTAYQAFADLEGNDATISVETQGMGPGTWTPEQCASLVALYVWAVRTHGIARKMATSSQIGTASQGLSWHRLGCDGNFPALPSILAGRTQRGGGMHYSKSLGKVCPGDDRIKQIPSIFTRAEAILGRTVPTPEDPMAEPLALDATQAKQLSNCNHFATAEIVEDFDGDQTMVNAVRRTLSMVRQVRAMLIADQAAPAEAAELAAEDVADALLAKLTPALAKGVADHLYARLAQ